MADVDTLKAAPKSTVVEASAPIGSMPIWSLHHYEHGLAVSRSIARGDQIREWLADLERAGHVLGFGWELRGQAAPDDWPGWPVDDEQDDEPEPCGESSCICYCIGDCHACGCDCPRQDGGAER